MRSLATAIAVLLISGSACGIASAKSCRDAHGKFMKCPAAMKMKMKAKPCRDAKGKFVKCSSMKKM